MHESYKIPKFPNQASILTTRNPSRFCPKRLSNLRPWTKPINVWLWGRNCYVNSIGGRTSLWCNFTGHLLVIGRKPNILETGCFSLGCDAAPRTWQWRWGRWERSLLEVSRQVGDNGRAEDQLTLVLEREVLAKGFLLESYLSQRRLLSLLCKQSKLQFRRRRPSTSIFCPDTTRHFASIC